MKKQWIFVIVLVILASLVAVFTMSGNAFLEFPHNVKLYQKDLSEPEIKDGRTTILTIVARNNEDKDTVTDIVAKLSVIEGANANEHLRFTESTDLASTLLPGQVSETKHIQIQALKVSGTETRFKMKAELFVDNKKTDEYLFDIKIIPNS